MAFFLGLHVLPHGEQKQSARGKGPSSWRTLPQTRRDERKLAKEEEQGSGWTPDSTKVGSRAVCDNVIY